MAGAAVDVTDATFEDVVLKSEKPVLVDFWAPWCGPCRMIAPAIEQLASEVEGQFVVTKLNIDDNQKTAMQFKVNSIPTLFIFKNGEIVHRVMGAGPSASKDNLKKALEEAAA